MDALKAAGNDAVRQGDYKAALVSYQQALSAADENTSASEIAALHSNCSFAHLKLGQLQEALEEANKAVAAQSNWSKGYFRLGEAHFALRDYSSAAEDYATASELAPEDATIKKRLSLATEAMDGFYFRQLLPGRDICLAPANIVERQIFSSAEQMQNYVYLIGDARTRECVVVDAAWDVKGIRAIAAADNMKLVGAVVTHYHFDHVGGVPPPPFDAFGIKVPGVFDIATEDKVKVYVNKFDAQTVETKCTIPAASIVKLEDGGVVNIGNVQLHFLHTPGHTPGSQCIYIPRKDGDILISGDTLFMGSCGRLDFPDCDPKAMYSSLQKKLASLPDSTRVYPGHDYGGPYTSIGDEKKKGLLKNMTESHWLKMHHRF